MRVSIYNNAAKRLLLDLAQDMVQEASLRAFKSLTAFTRRRSRVATHHCAQHLFTHGWSKTAAVRL